MRWIATLLIAAAPLASALFAAEVPIAADDLPASRAMVGQAVAASDGVDALVVYSTWSQSRSFIGSISRIFCTRISRSGNVLDVPAKLLAAGSVSGLEVAYTAGRYLVLWRRILREEHYSIDAVVEGALLDRGGNVVRMLSLPDRYVPRGLVAANGRFLFAHDLGFDVISTEGERIKQISGNTWSSAQPSLGGFVLVARWQQGCTPEPCERMKLVRTSADGEVLAERTLDFPLEADTSIGTVSLAAGDDGGLLLTYLLQNRDYQAQAVLSIAVNDALHSIGEPREFAVLPDEGRLWNLWDDAHYVVFARTAKGTTVAQRLGVDSAPFVVSDGALVNIVLNAGGYIVSVIKNELTVELRSDLATPAPPILPASALADQSEPLLATDGRAIVAGWKSAGVQRSAILANGGARALPYALKSIRYDGKDFLALTSNGGAQFLSPSGEPLAPSVKFNLVSDVVWNGNLFLAQLFNLGIGRNRLLFERLTRGGELLDAQPIILEDFFTNAAMATNGKDAFSVAIVRNADDSYTSYLARFGADGTTLVGDPIPLDWPISLAADGDDVYAVGTLGDGYTTHVSVVNYTADLHKRWQTYSTSRQGRAPAIAVEHGVATVVWLEEEGAAGARVGRDARVHELAVIATTDPIADVRVSVANDVTVVGYLRVAPEAPYFGALRFFVQRSLARRRAVGR